MFQTKERLLKILHSKFHLASTKSSSYLTIRFRFPDGHKDEQKFAPNCLIEVSNIQINYMYDSTITCITSFLYLYAFVYSTEFVKDCFSLMSLYPKNIPSTQRCTFEQHEYCC